MKHMKPKRKDLLRFKLMPNGNIRGYRATEDKRGASEWQIINPANVSSSIIAHVHGIPKIIEIYEIHNST
jgi:hypothetical protein